MTKGPMIQTLHEKMLGGLRDARAIASPYADAGDDPDERRRDLAHHFDAIIAEAEEGCSGSQTRVGCPEQESMMAQFTPRPLVEQLRGLDAMIAEQNRRMAQARKGDLCPECGETDAIQDNGASGIDRMFRCETCNNQWDTSIGKDG